MASEKARQREVHKYYQSWLDSSIGFDASSHQTLRYHGDGSQLRHSKDKALISFAQLGCLRLNVKRSVVTLISTDQQYILAEATKTLSLISGDGDPNVNDDLWFGNASFPRSQGVSGDALAPPEYTASCASGISYTAPALVINDITTHEQYKSRGYAGQGVSFYCGVPILTESGIAIGVYTVVDDRPRDGLTPEELRFMHDMAATVMRHLDIVRNEAARFRGETMVLGLGRFISGALSLYDHDPPADATTEVALTEPESESAEHLSTRHFKGMTITAANPTKLRANRAGEMLHQRASSTQGGLDVATEAKHGQSEPAASEPNQLGSDPKPEAGSQESSSQPVPTNQSILTNQSVPTTQSVMLSDSIFSRAARILRQCVAADGVMFFDATSTNIAGRTNMSEAGPPDERFNTGMTNDTLTVGRDGIQVATDNKSNAASLYSGGSEDSDMGPTTEADKRMCKLLGHAFELPDHAGMSHDILNDLKMTERSVRRLVKLYPQGKHFSFHVDGEMSASDGDPLSEDFSTASFIGAGSNNVTSTHRPRRMPRTIADEFARLVPQARSIVWLPIWDFIKQGWSAGLFLWSRRPDRLVAAQEDLVYLKAFANSIMIEVARLDAARADVAKSTFIANISHELRTPLHGILGNLDILKDTRLNNFQRSLTTAIEVCGRTLCDTIDHVLDYSKINQLSKNQRTRNKSSSTPLSPISQDIVETGQASMIDEDFNLAAIIEEAVESAYASHAFQSSGRTLLRAPSLSNKNLIRGSSDTVRKVQPVHVVVDLEQQPHWWVHSQPSAIRRIVTNLFGNALKYTATGIIQVSLSSARPNKVSSTSSKVSFVLSIKDTGKGMSSEFVRNRAFTPFSQESQFNIGTGLGLSIVQQIIKSLGGKIELQSHQGVGTDISVSLSLPSGKEAALQEPREGNNTHVVSFPLVASTRTAQILTADDTNAGTASPGLSRVISSLQMIVQDWLKMRLIVSNSSQDDAADCVIFATPPSREQLLQMLKDNPLLMGSQFVVIASTPIEKANLVTEYLLISEQKILQVEVISHPVGPQKLGDALNIADDLKREGGARHHKNGHSQYPQSSMLVPVTSTSKTSTGKNEETSTYGDEDFQRQPLHSIEDKDGLQAEYTETSTDTDATQSVPPKTNTRANARSQLPHTQLRSMSAPVSLSSTDAASTTRPLIRVLLVDDNDINLTILKTCMKRAQIPYGFAKDGLEAIRVFEQAYSTNSAFSHVLMDISMPIMDGIQATRGIREFERRQNNLQRVSSQENGQPAVRTSTGSLDKDDAQVLDDGHRATVVALSGVASDATQHEMLEAGADMFLPKPVKMKELLKILAI